MVKIKGHDVDIDIRSELERFTWHRAIWKSDKLIAASPFRYDRSPSWFCNLSGPYAGAWADSGASDPTYASGGFVKLYSFLHNISYEEAEDELLLRYDTGYVDADNLTLNMNHLRIKRRRQSLDSSLLKQYMYRHPYLGKRGISEEVQRTMRIGYCRTSKAVTIPWFTPDGKLANIKFRKVGEKTFWYQRGGIGVRSLVWGIDIVYKNQQRECALVESETDAMFLMSAGVNAIATGGSVLTDEKAEVIKRSPIERLYIATDNDPAGRLLQQQVIDKLSGSVELFTVRIPDEYKDVNDIGDYAEVRQLLTKADRMKILPFRNVCGI